MHPAPKVPFTTGSATFNPDALFAQWQSGDRPLPENNDLRTSIIHTFNLPPNDNYIYHAIASVTLTQVQQAIGHGRDKGLHAWYRDDDGHVLDPPTAPDISAYTTLFSPSTTPSKALTAFASNARKSSIRHASAAYLASLRQLPATITIPRSKQHINPALDFWNWSCHALEWCGPVRGTEKVKQSHHVLPVFMHHFGCVVPSFEALEVIRQIAGGTRAVYDVGSGNGYWSYMLRRHGVAVVPVDNAQSVWRTMWVGDTLEMDGVGFLRGRGGAAGREEGVLLLVYPVVGGEFTRRIVGAYEGRTIVVAGTQNGNGYTGFQDERIEEWMGRERGAFRKTVQVALPSFAGKDEALFVFEKGEGKP